MKADETYGLTHMSDIDHDFSADRPILSIDQDLLDRDRFAESLARAISGWKGKDSLIVALHGDWGSGKSSLKNMALSAFAKQKLESPLVIEFNPWEWAGQDKISKSFFEQLASSIGMCTDFALNYVFTFMKCFDAKRSFEDEANYYMEREWRIGGNVQFTLNDVSRVFFPSNYAKKFRVEDQLASYIGQINFID